MSSVSTPPPATTITVAGSTTSSSSSDQTNDDLSWWGRQFDMDFIKSLFSMREVYAKCNTRRKFLYYFVYLCCLGGLVTAIYFFHQGMDTFLAQVIRSHSIVATVVLYCYEPLLLLLTGIFVPYPAPTGPSRGTRAPSMTPERPLVKYEDEEQRLSPTDTEVIDENNTTSSDERSSDLFNFEEKEDLSELAILITCHQSAQFIENTCRACMKHVNQNQIFVLDNNNTEKSLDNLEQVLLDAGLNEVNYIFNPIGNKSAAAYAGAVAAKPLKYCLIIDDDVTLPETMHFGVDMLSDKDGCICYPIKPLIEDEGRGASLLVQWQGLEYQMAGYTKMVQHTWSTVLYPHGAIALYKREVLIDVLRHHDLVFYAEDTKMGACLLKLGYEMRINHRNEVATEVPCTLFGATPNYYQQRVRSWDMGLHVYAGMFIGQLFTTSHSTAIGLFIMKWYQLYTVYSILFDVIVIPTTVLYALYSWKTLVIIVPSYVVAATVNMMVWNILGYRRNPQMRAGCLVIVTFPIYKFIMTITRVLGMFRAYFIFLPNFKYAPKLAEREAQVDRSKSIRKNIPVWLDETKPSWKEYFHHYKPDDPKGENNDLLDNETMLTGDDDGSDDDSFASQWA